MDECRHFILLLSEKMCTFAHIIFIFLHSKNNTND